MKVEKIELPERKPPVVDDECWLVLTWVDDGGTSTASHWHTAAYDNEESARFGVTCLPDGWGPCRVFKISGLKEADDAQS